MTRNMLLMIDNYDSFTFNLVQYFGEVGRGGAGDRNDAVDLAGVRALDPSAIVISPGPGTPDDAGISLEVLAALSGVMPIFGVCAGHQAIGQAFGGKVVRARSIMHGKTSPIHHDGRGVFAGLPNPLRPRVTTRWWWSRLRCRSVWRFRPGPRMRTAAATRSWACAIAASRSKACSSSGIHPHQHGHAMLRNFLDHGLPRAAADPPFPSYGKPMPITPQQALQRCIEHREIFHDEMVELMHAIMRGEIADSMLAAILTGLRVKKESIGEIGMRRRR